MSDDDTSEPKRRPSSRAEKSRAAIAKAFIDLVREGNRKPTAPIIAERAGVSERLVYHHFNDMMSLFLEAHKFNAPVVWDYFSDVLYEGSFEERRDYFVKSRARAFEFVTTTRAYVYHHAYRANDVAKLTDIVWDTEMKQISRIFQPELAGFSGEERATRETNLHAVCSWNYWNILRNSAKQSVQKARAAVHHAITLTLAAEI